MAFCNNIFSQDSTDLMNQLVNQGEKNKIIYAQNTFKYTRVVDGHSVENLHKKVLDVRISHRFDPINSGIYNFFGLDAAVMRLGFDYGISDNFMIGESQRRKWLCFDRGYGLRLHPNCNIYSFIQQNNRKWKIWIFIRTRKSGKSFKNFIEFKKYRQRKIICVYR